MGHAQGAGKALGVKQLPGPGARSDNNGQDTRRDRAVIWRSRAGHIALTILAGAGLFGLGLETGYVYWRGETAKAQNDAVDQANRAARLTVENRSLEERLALLEDRLSATRKGTGGFIRGRAQSRVLTRQRSTVLLDGLLVVTLLEISGKPKKAYFKLKLPGKTEGTAALDAGGSVAIKAGNKVYDFVVTSVGNSTAGFTLIPRRK